MLRQPLLQILILTKIILSVRCRVRHSVRDVVEATSLVVVLEEVDQGALGAEACFIEPKHS